MSDQALSQQAMLTSLRDIRLPEAAAGGWPADLAVAVGLAGAAALLVTLCLRALSQRRAAPSEPSPRQAFERARALPEAERRVALLALLRSHAPERYAALTRDLYSPTGAPETQALEAEVAARV